MLIILPTYRRTHCLKMVLTTLFDSNVKGIDESIRVIISNNDFSNRASVDSIVGLLEIPEKFKLSVVHNNPSLTPADNFYRPIKKFAHENEVVLLQGDDDLFTPNGLIDRYAAMQNSNCDMLLSRSAHRIFFCKNSEKLILFFDKGYEDAIKSSGRVYEIGFDEIHDHGSAFIGNHVYRNNQIWRDSLYKAMQWCDGQNWSDQSQRTLMLPYYIPFAVKILGGNLFALDSVCVIRGADFDEHNHLKFGAESFNPGIAYLSALNVMNNYDLMDVSKLNTTRGALTCEAYQWLPTLFFDNRYKNSYVLKLMKTSGMKFKFIDCIGCINGFKLIIINLFCIKKIVNNKSALINISFNNFRIKMSNEK